MKGLFCYIVLTLGEAFSIISSVLCLEEQRMKLFFRPLLSILSYVISIYLLHQGGFLLGIEFIHQAKSSLELMKVYLFIGIVFWFGFVILKFVLNIFTFPIQYMTLWIVSWVTNIVVMYVCHFLINVYLTGIQMHITSIASMLITSVILSFVVSIVYRVLKKIL